MGFWRTFSIQTTALVMVVTIKIKKKKRKITVSGVSYTLIRRIACNLLAIDFGESYFLKSLKQSFLVHKMDIIIPLYSSHYENNM
jgi:hypothetical protein